MKFLVPEAVIVVDNLNGSPEQACEVLFYGNYHFCGDADAGHVLCCLGDIH